MFGGLTELWNCVTTAREYREVRLKQLREEKETEETKATLASKCPHVMLQWLLLRDQQLREKSLKNYATNDFSEMQANARSYMELWRETRLSPGASCEDLGALLLKMQSKQVRAPKQAKAT